MLDRTDFASWQQRIRLYCRGKKNGVNILKSIDEGSYKMGTIRETLAESTEGAPQFGPERSRVYSDLTSKKKDRYNADIRATNILLQGLPKDIYTLINHYTNAKDIWDNVKMLLEGSELTKEDRESQLFSKLINDMRNIKMTMSRLQLNSKFVNNMLPEWGRFVTAVKLNRGLRDSNYDQLYAYLKQHETHAKENKMITFLPQTNNQLRTYFNARNQATVQDGKVVVQNVQGRPNRGQGMNPRSRNAAGYVRAQNRVGNVNQGQARPGQARTVKCYNCNGTGHIAQENGVALDAEQLLFLAGGQDNTFDDDVDEQPIQDLALNVDNVFHVDDCDAFDSDVDEAPTAQTMFMANLSSTDPVTDKAGPSYDSDISSKYVKNNEVPVVYSNVSSVLNDAFMMIYNDMCEPLTQSISNPSRNTIVKNSLTDELATYKEHVELYEQRAKFELIKGEQKINEQLSLVISDRNFKEETLKRELHSIKLQLASTINHNKSMVEEVSFLKKDFKQKENKYLEDFLDMKSLKERVEDKLIKQDQSLQTVHMLCRPRSHYNELNKVAIGYKNPLCLTRAKQIQPALYNGHEILKDNHAPAKVHNTEDTLEMAEMKMNDKMNNPESRFTEMHVANTTVESRCLVLEAELVNLRDKCHHDNQEELINHFSKLETTDSQITRLTDHVTNLQAQNDLFRAENDKIKQHYKELYDSIKITRAKHIEQVTKLTIENVNLKNSVSKDKVKPQVLIRSKHAIDVEPIFSRLKNNRDAHLDYVRHFTESVETIRDIVEEAEVVRPLDRSIISACRYTKHSQELLEYAIGTYPQGSQPQAKQLAHIPLIGKKQVTIAKPSDKSDRTTHKHGVTVKTKKTNVHVPPSTGVNNFPKASGS
nr:hypothetical protein [Tanacetum cinerariifolium]